MHTNSKRTLRKMRIQNFSFSGITLSTVWVSFENRARMRPEGVTWKWERGARSVEWSKEMCMTRAALNAPLQANRVLQNIVSTRIQQPRRPSDQQCPSLHFWDTNHTFIRQIFTKLKNTIPQKLNMVIYLYRVSQTALIKCRVNKRVKLDNLFQE